MAKRLALALLASLALALPACAQAPSPSRSPCDPMCEVVDLRAITPTSFHRTIYEMMEQCAGRRGDFDSLQWYIARAILPATPIPGRRILGLYSNSRIVLDQEYAFDGETVSHESLHAIFGGPVPMDIAQACVLQWQILARAR